VGKIDNSVYVRDELEIKRALQKFRPSLISSNSPASEAPIGPEAYTLHQSRFYEHYPTLPIKTYQIDGALLKEN
jgi:hypothetical protein